MAARGTLSSCETTRRQLVHCDGLDRGSWRRASGGGHVLVVSKVGVSPLPGDSRACAYSVGKG